MSRIALVTCPRISDRWPDSETPGVLDALGRLGLDAETVPWYADVAWDAYQLVVLRSPWDVYWHLDDFLTWIDGVNAVTTVCNSAALVRWNLDKHYLGALPGASISTIPTTFAEPGDVPVFPDREFVVKPVLSAGALNTARYGPGDTDAARRHVDELHRRGMAVMVQPYIESVDSRGEIAMVFFNGVFDHAIRKGAVLAPGESPDTIRNSHPSPVAHEASPAEIDLAQRALATIPGGSDVLYARIDMAALADGSPAIMELELTDPVLFLTKSEGATERYAQAIASRLAG